jgi:hypothetical protein
VAEIAIDFLRAGGWSSRLIAWFGQGAGGYSHVASVLKDGRYLDSRDDRLGGVPPGVHIREVQLEPWVKKLRATLQVTDQEYADWEANLRAKITDSYGRSDIMSFILGVDDHTPGHWVCSALAINALQHIKIVPYPLPIPAHQISPNAALLICATAGFKIGPVWERAS